MCVCVCIRGILDQGGSLLKCSRKYAVCVARDTTKNRKAQWIFVSKARVNRVTNLIIYKEAWLPLL